MRRQTTETLKMAGQMEAETTTTAQILLRSDEKRKELKKELEYLISKAFPEISEEYLKINIRDYFKEPEGSIHRQVIFFRNELGKLIAATIFDDNEDVRYGDAVMRGIYLISRTVLPEYQKMGLGKTIAQKILKKFRPDVLFTSCAQSSSLHSWINLREKGLAKDFEVYPRFERKNGKECLRTLPYKDLDFAINIFRQIYVGVAEGDQKYLDQAVRNLTVMMVRKNLYGGMYDFDPWNKDGREDRLAKALDLTDRDGVLVMFVRKRKEG